MAVRQAHDHEYRAWEKVMNRKHAGDILEPRTLESIQGSSVPIPHATQLTHLQFRRFAGCPMCNLHIQSFIKRHAELVAQGIQVVAVFHSSKNAMLEHQSSTPFPLIADPAKSLYKAFGVESSVLSVLNPKAWPAAIKGLLRHGPGFPARGESALGLPAEFLIDNSGQILAAKYGKHAYDQWGVEEVLELARKAKRP